MPWLVIHLEIRTPRAPIFSGGRRSDGPGPAGAAEAGTGAAGLAGAAGTGTGAAGLAEAAGTGTGAAGLAEAAEAAGAAEAAEADGTRTQVPDFPAMRPAATP